MKKIAFINSTLSLGGAEKMTYEVIKGLDRSRFHAASYCMYRPGFIGKAIMSEGIDFKHSFMEDKYDLAGVYRLFTLLKKEKADVLYLENSPLVLFWGFICGRLLGIPHIVTVIHTMRKPEQWKRIKSGFINRLVLPRLDRIGVVSKIKLDSLIKEYNLDPGTVELINNAIDLNGFRPLEGKDRDEKIIGMVGRLVTEKAYDVFLKSARRVLDCIPNVRFMIIGEGRERKNLERLARDLGLGEKSIFLGERHDARDFISLFDVAVLSSRVESFPVVLLEYMAGSRPIVATNVGGNPEIILHGTTGLIVPPEDPGLLADSIMELLNNPKKAQGMGLSARKLVEEKFSLPRLMTKIEEFFLSGTTYHILMTGPSLDSKGGISSFAKNYLGSEAAEQFKIIYHPTTTDGSGISKSLYFFKSLVLFFVRLAGDKKIKIIHICSASRGSFYRKAIVAVISKLFKKSVIFHIHGAGFDVFYNNSHPLRRFCIRRILNLSDSIVVLSKIWHSAVKGMTENKNIRVIPNPINISDFKSIMNKKAFSGLNVFTVGRLEKRKGTYDILDIVPAVLKKVPSARFYLAGDGDVEGVRALCRKKGIEKNIVLLGWLDKKRLIEEFEKASLFLLPSYHEGFPVAILEAMASGLPVISTRVGGIPELIEDGKNGFLVEPGQKQELEKRIIELLGDKGLRRKIGRNNIDKVDLMFRLDRVVDKFFDAYRDVLSGRSCHE